MAPSAMTAPQLQSYSLWLSFGQFIFGVLIVALNALLLMATVAERKLKTASYYFAANLWLANCLLGSTIAIANVVDSDRRLSLMRPEGTVILLNCAVTFATLLAHNTARLIFYRSTQYGMSRWSAVKVVLSIWTAVVTLSILKSLAFSLIKITDGEMQDEQQPMGYHGQCFRCVLGFETAMLTIFCLANLPIFLIALYHICARARSNVHDSSRAHPLVDYNKELRMTVTSGLWLLTIVLCFAALAVLLAAHTVYPQGVLLMDVGSLEAILAFYCLHAVLNPLIATARDPDMLRGVRRMICCDASGDGERRRTNRRLLMQQNDEPPPPYESRRQSSEELNAEEEDTQPPPTDV